MSGPQDRSAGALFPRPGDKWTVDVFYARWPFATKVELIDGAPIWYTDGEPWDERDIETAERTFPDWQAVLESDGYVLTLRPKPD